ncbi:precorrin-2 dehydrogenase/sirohydrochlorin ferrochelatase family protein [Castellaniella sp.]|uniref:precorrin-2 dehydrogenase/sirohydrochlorin ferrochelatase family protein n=1 Tax=Castellaniella sp. TaxID=1955812 RepID=UPI002AFFA272|nr:NAD(P)-dependent oxidoreductase [Castellaniella sp.]
MKPLYPLFADLTGRPVLVVGGGVVAERKVRSLLKCGASVRVGAPRLTAALRRWADTACLTYLPGPFQSDWLDAAWLVIAATGDRRVNAQVRMAADARGVLANVVDDPGLSSFQVPAVVDRSPLVIAVSSSGAAPVLARRVRERIEALFDASLGALMALADRHRQAIRQAYPDPGARCRFYDWLHDGPVPVRLRQGDVPGAEELLRCRLASAATEAPLACRVTWITVCPADPGRLTLNELRAMNEAEVLVHEPDLPAPWLDMARRDADRRVLSAGSDAAGALELCAGYRRAVILLAEQDQKSNSGSMASPACSQ